ncbi:MAG: hypothetical protein Q8K63_13775 [Acidimicrobiales bacterium]|nr:hypothetical protein [Acidimicrobiales bacterium]
MSKAKNRSDADRRIRKRMRSQGYSDVYIDVHLADLARRRERHINAAQAEEARAVAARLAAQEAELERLADTQPWEPPDDKSFRPRRVDPIETGPARVTPATAKAARRKNATTRYEQERAS